MCWQYLRIDAAEDQRGEVEQEDAELFKDWNISYK
jgi:hypothetical protein